MATLAELPCDAITMITNEDWVELAKALRRSHYTLSDVAELFYPKYGDLRLPQVPEIQLVALRRKVGFLQEMTDDAYHRIFLRIYHGSTLCFPDVEHVLKTMSKDRGRIMKQVMKHVVRWVNNHPTESSDSRDSNKSLLREDLKPILRHAKNDMQLSRSNTACDTPSGGGQTEDAEGVEAQIEKDSILLERDILDAVLRDMTFFEASPTRAALDVFPKDNDDETYGQRFANTQWKTILDIVWRKVGSSLRSFDCYLRYLQHSRAASQDGSPQTDAGRTTSTIAQSIGALAPNVPEVATNPALNTPQAMQELTVAINGAVSAWVVERCTKALKERRDPYGQPARSHESLQIIKTAKRTHESILQSQVPVGVLTDVENDAASSMTEWSDPPQEDLTKLLHDLESSAPARDTTAADRRRPEEPVVEPRVSSRDDKAGRVCCIETTPRHLLSISSSASCTATRDEPRMTQEAPTSAQLPEE